MMPEVEVGHSEGDLLIHKEVYDCFGGDVAHHAARQLFFLCCQRVVLKLCSKASVLLKSVACMHANQFRCHSPEVAVVTCVQFV